MPPVVNPARAWGRGRTTELGRLQFPHERRKIRCAQRYFATIGMTYLTIDPQKMGQWWDKPLAADQPLGI